MIRPAIGTIATRVFVQVMNLLVIVVAGHRLGAVGLGDISLVVLGITIVMLVNNLVGGGALVYLVPRHPLKELLPPAYAWAVITAGIAWVLVKVLPLVPDRFEGHVVVLAFIQSIYTVHMNVLLGRQRIRAFNLLGGAQALVLLLVFAVLVFRPTGDPMDYVWASYAAFGTTLIGSTFAMWRGGAATSIVQGESVLRVLLRQGFLIQSANLLQLMNYRLAYYLVERFQGLAALGIYSVGNQLSESAWLGPKALGTVLYSRVSNSDDAERNRRTTLTVLKAAVAFAGLVLLVLLLMPEPLFQWAFGPEVVGITPLVLLLAPGILAMAASQALSHYFSGIGANGHNAIGSGLGLLVTVLLGMQLIPTQGIHGAAITASVAYGLNVLYQGVVFMVRTGSTPLDLLPHAGDLERVRGIWSALRARR